MALVVQARMFVLLAFACLTCLVLWPTSSSKARPRRPALEEELLPTGGDDSEPLQQQVANPMVQVDLHVMSMCPDAAFCEDYFTSVLEKVSDIAVLTTQYIAQVRCFFLFLFFVFWLDVCWSKVSVCRKTTTWASRACTERTSARAIGCSFARESSTPI